MKPDRKPKVWVKRAAATAVIVVASAVPFDAASLAPWLGATAPGSLSAAVQMSAFLDALARLDLARVTLKILPYRVRRRG